MLRRAIAVGRPGEKVKIAKGNLNHKFIIGHPFGTKFEVTKAGNEQTVSVVEEDETDRANMMADELQGEEEDDPEVKRDNRDLVDWNKLTKGQRTGQKLSDQDVADLRAQGADGKSLIKSLAENSETFKSKTEFSQEKWVKRKASKHMPSFIAHRQASPPPPTPPPTPFRPLACSSALVKLARAALPPRTAPGLAMLTLGAPGARACLCAGAISRRTPCGRAT